jgi:hypothetical protein
VRDATCLVLCSVGFFSVCLSSVSPAAGGFVVLLLTKERVNHMRATLFSYLRERDVLCYRVGGRLDDPCSDPAIMAHLVPEQWRLQG